MASWTAPVENAILTLERPAVSARDAVATVTLLSAVALLIHGYHPYADDAAIYVAGIKKMVHPGMYGSDSVFITTHTKLSVFAHLFAGVVRYLHLPLEPLLFAAYMASLFVFLLACYTLSTRLFQSSLGRWGATLAACTCMTMPVAGTALSLMDPYLTARSFSTPFSVFALVAVIDRSWKRTVLWLALTAAMHPLMAIYAGAFLLTFHWIDTGRLRTLAGACLAAFVASGAIFVLTLHASYPDGYREAALSRSYFFLSQWQWFEISGLVLPLVLMGFALRRASKPIRDLCLACIVVGGVTVAICTCFVHTNGSLLLARVQLLRNYQMIYLAGLLMLGGYLAYVAGERNRWSMAVLFTGLAVLMFAVQMRTYPASRHVEWPGAHPQNRWKQAFLWIRTNTPKDAFFAIDPDYTASSDEDTQGFRAIAERGVLADHLKDGGVAAIFPALAPQWKAQRELESGIDHWTDAERIARLRPAGVTWVLLAANTPTGLHCPYRNSRAQVCELK